MDTHKTWKPLFPNKKHEKPKFFENGTFGSLCDKHTNETLHFRETLFSKHIVSIVVISRKKTLNRQVSVYGGSISDTKKNSKEV